MTSPAVKRATYDDILALPPHVVGEVIHGVLRTFPRPRTRHARAASRLGSRLEAPFDSGLHGGPGGWLFLPEPELHLGADILVPDLAGWRREHMPELPDEPYLTLSPDWVCEILSPSTEDTDRADKVPIYARENVSYVWLVDPALKTLEVLRLDGPTYRLIGTLRGDAVIGAEPFDAVPLDLGALWAR